MKIQLLVSTGILLVALLPFHECKSIPTDRALQQPDPEPPQPSLPILLRMGEEYFLRLGNLQKHPPAASSSSFSSSSTSSSSSSHLSTSTGNFFRAAAMQQLQQQLQERSLEGQDLETPQKEKRSEEPPISLDLTFHLLREVLEMARAEQLAQQAHSNRKLMEIIGK